MILHPQVITKTTSWNLTEHKIKIENQKNKLNLITLHNKLQVIVRRRRSDSAVHKETFLDRTVMLILIHSVSTPQHEGRDVTWKWNYH